MTIDIKNITNFINDKFMSLVMWRERHIKEKTFVIGNDFCQLGVDFDGIDLGIGVFF